MRIFLCYLLWDFPLGSLKHSLAMSQANVFALGIDGDKLFTGVVCKKSSR
jgi:hypothetical protein